MNPCGGEWGTAEGIPSACHRPSAASSLLSRAAASASPQVFLSLRVPLTDLLDCVMSPGLSQDGLSIILRVRICLQQLYEI